MSLSSKEQDRLRSLEKDAEEAYKYMASDEQSSTFKNEELIYELDAAVPQPQTTTSKKFTRSEIKETKPWVHFVAGGIGGTVGAVVTCPLDVVKTRLQSDVYHNVYNTSVKSGNPIKQAFQHLSETGGALGDVCE